MNLQFTYTLSQLHLLCPVTNVYIYIQEKHVLGIILLAGQLLAASARSFQCSWSVGMEILIEFGYWGAVWEKSSWENMVLHCATFSASLTKSVGDPCLCRPCWKLTYSIQHQGISIFFKWVYHDIRRS